MSDNLVNATFKASSTIFDNRTEITWNSPICAFVIECRLIDGGDGRWEEIGRVPADRISFSLANSPDNSKFQYRIVAKMINDITLESESTGIPSLASKVKSEIGDDGTTLDCKPMSVQDWAPPPVNTPPPPPLELKYDIISPSYIKLSWNPPAIGLADSPITSYIIERSSDDNPNWSRVVSVNGDKTTSVVKLHKCEYQAFRVMAVNASGDISTPLVSEQIRQRLPVAPIVKVDTSSRKYIEMKWTIPTHSQTSYEKLVSFHVQRRVEYSTDKIGKKNFTNITKPFPAGHTGTFRDLNVFPDRMYQYKVISVGSDGSKSGTMTQIVRINDRSETKEKSGGSGRREDRSVRNQEPRERKDLALTMKNSKKAIKQEDEPGPSGIQQQQIPIKNEVAPISSSLVKMEVDSD